ncbi:MAG: GGDEF domain-containing protein [Nitrospirae bacterium]|nr:GGDEF domain-containing protein [Nitrospirota bacterium]
MKTNFRQFLKNTVLAIELGYRIVRGIDYQTLSQYILKINKHNDINDILFEASRCLKDILDYELFGFALKNVNSMDIWIDSRIYSASFSEYVSNDFGSQNIDAKIHYFEKNLHFDSHNSDAIEINNLISYTVINGNSTARLYILPKRTMLDYHDTIISTIVDSISIALEKNLSRTLLENAAAIDPLTNCYNRRALDSFIENDIAYAQRNRKDLSIIMLDIDNFKGINDTYGHLAGDAVLREISTMLPTLVRKSDYLARYGGEEFVLVLPDSSLYHAVQLADKIRKTIERRSVRFEDKSITFTASFGVACLENKTDRVSLLKEADERMYRAKATGKNRVVPSLLPCFADRSFVLQDRVPHYAGAA